MNLSGSPLDFVFAFLGGVLVSFTPCVYPLLPISASFIGANAAGSKTKGFTLSLIYVTGIAITYSLLGLIASLGGQMFGWISSLPVTNFIVGTVILTLSISMFDIFHLNLPKLINFRLKKENYFSTFLLGLVSGLVIGPCLTPVLGSILAYLAATKHIFYGMSLLFIFAYGMGLSLILVGTFSGLLVALPKPGKWLVYIQRFSASILLAVGLYFIYLGIRSL